MESSGGILSSQTTSKHSHGVQVTLNLNEPCTLNVQEALHTQDILNIHEHSDE